MIEKLGHKKRLQKMRREWIDEGKPRNIFDDDTVEDTTRSNVPRVEAKPDTSPTNMDRSAREEPDKTVDLDLGDLYSATPEPPSRNDKSSKNDHVQKDALFLTDDEHDQHPQDDDIDDLDALLAEDDLRESHSENAIQGREQFHNKYDLSKGKEDNFDDEMEAMAGMDDMW